MKNILLSSVAIVAFAGAAAAEVTFSGEAALGYNDEVVDGVYADVDLDITMSQELNNGWTATVTYGLELEEFSNDQDVTTIDDTNMTYDDNLTLSLSNGTYSLEFGETEYAAKEYWSGVSEMGSDDFSEQDGEDVLKVSGMFGGIEAAVSTGVNTDTGETFQSSFGAKGEFGNVNFSIAYQEETDTNTTSQDAWDNGDFKEAETLGVSVGTSIGGADIKLAYAQTKSDLMGSVLLSDGTTRIVNPVDKDSTGIEVSYPAGDITLGAFYVSESVGEDNYGVSAVYAANAIEAKGYYKSLNDNDEFGLGASYTMGELVVSAGYIGGDSLTDDDFGTYIVADYDLGGGASILASYADGTDAGVGSDDIDTVVGGYELNDGFTVELGLKF